MTTTITLKTKDAEGKAISFSIGPIVKDDYGWRKLVADLQSDARLDEDRLDEADEAVADFIERTENRVHWQGKELGDGQIFHDNKVVATLRYTQELLAGKRDSLYRENIAGLEESGYDMEEIVRFGYDPRLVKEVLA